MEQKFSPQSKVKDAAELLEFQSISKKVYNEYNALCARLKSLKRETVTVTENTKKAEADYYELASKQAKEKIKTAVIISSVIAAVIYIIVFIIALIKANYLSERIFAIVLPGLLIGLALYVVINLIKGAFEEMHMDNLRTTEDYVKAIEEAKEKDQQLTIQLQKSRDDEADQIEAQKNAILSQYGNLINGWEKTIAKAKNEAHRSGFSFMSEEEIFKKLIYCMPQDAVTYEDAMKCAFDQLKIIFANAKSAFEICNKLINDINTHVENSKKNVENDVIRALKAQYSYWGEDEIRKRAKEEVERNSELREKIRVSTEPAIRQLEAACKGYSFTVRSDGSVSPLNQETFLRFIMK